MQLSSNLNEKPVTFPEGIIFHPFSHTVDEPFTAGRREKGE